MDKRISPLPMIGLIALTSVAIVTTSVMAIQHQRAKEEQAENAVAAERERRDFESAAVNKQRGEDAVRQAEIAGLTKQQAYERTADGKEAKRLEEDDRRWLAEHPLSPTPPKATAH